MPNPPWCPSAGTLWPEQRLHAWSGDCWTSSQRCRGWSAQVRATHWPGHPSTPAHPWWRRDGATLGFLCQTWTSAGKRGKPGTRLGRRTIADVEHHSEQLARHGHHGMRRARSQTWQHGAPKAGTGEWCGRLAKHLQVNKQREREKKSGLWGFFFIYYYLNALSMRERVLCVKVGVFCSKVSAFCINVRVFFVGKRVLWKYECTLCECVLYGCERFVQMRAFDVIFERSVQMWCTLRVIVRFMCKSLCEGAKVLWLKAFVYTRGHFVWM